MNARRGSGPSLFGTRETWAAPFAALGSGDIMPKILSGVVTGLVSPRARLARVIAPGIPHHVTQRGNRGQQTFFGEGAIPKWGYVALVLAC